VPCEAGRRNESCQGPRGALDDSARLSLQPRQASLCVPRATIGSVSEQKLQDLLLLGVRSLRAARARRVRDDVQRSRTLTAVPRIHTSAALEKTANGFRTPRANRAMQWSRASFVLLLDVRASV